MAPHEPPAESGPEPGPTPESESGAWPEPAAQYEAAPHESGQREAGQNATWQYETAPEPLRPSATRRFRAAFRRWRHTRPFWGGVLVTVGGGEILFTEKAPLGVVLHVGMQGLTGYLLPALMILCGLLLLFAPPQRTFYSVLSVLLALGTWLTSNLGGFLIGMLLGVVGGSLAFGWTPRAGARSKQPKAKSKRRLTRHGSQTPNSSIASSGVSGANTPLL